MEASRLRAEFYECLTARRDEMFELTDALFCIDGPVTSPVDLTMVPEHRRGRGALYGALNRGRIDVERLRALLTGLPKRPASTPSRRPSTWPPWSDAPASGPDSSRRWFRTDSDY